MKWFESTFVAGISNLYFGNFIYFATGEGYHSYMGIFNGKDGDDLHLNFFNFLKEREPNFNWPYEFWKYGVDILKLSEYDWDSYTRKTPELKENIEKISRSHPILKQYMEIIEDLISKGGMIHGDFYLKFCYNLS